MHTLLLTNFTRSLSQTVTNLGPRPVKNITFSTYKFAIAEYNLNFKLIYNHLISFKWRLLYFFISFWKLVGLQHIKLLTYTRTLIEEWHWRIRASKPKVKHHNRRQNFIFYMRNNKIKIVGATSRKIFRPFLFANCHTFSDSSLPWSVKYFMHGRETFITCHSVIQRRSDLIIPCMRDAIVQSKSFAYVGPSD